MPLSQNTPEKSEVQKAEEKQQEKVDKIDKKHADLLLGAAASGDAAVHELLGHRAIAELNQDENALKEIDGKLADLLK